MHKSILRAIQTEILTLATESWIKKYLVAGWLDKSLSWLPFMNSRIATLELALQTMLNPLVKEIFVDVALGSVWKNRTPRQIIRTGIDGSIPISTQIHSGISKIFTITPSDSNGTKSSIRNSGNSTAPPAEDLRSPGIGNKRQLASPNLRVSDKLDTFIVGKFSNNLVVQPIFAEVYSNKLSNRYNWDLYSHVGMHLVTYPVNPMTPHLVHLR